MKIVVVGSLNLDFVVQASRFPEKGETLMGDNSTISFGGKGANQAVCAAKLGADVSMVGCLGNDGNGTLMLENLKKHQIHTGNINIIENISSGIAQITIAENDNTIIIVSGANAHMGKNEINGAMDTILNADIVMLQLEIPLPTVRYVIDLCYEHNIKTILNPAPACDLDLNMIDKVTYLTPNEIEVEQIFKDCMEHVLPNYPNKIIMTAGGKGVFYHDGENLQNIACENVKVVDTTGAGDTFNGAFAYAIAFGKSMESAIKFGNKIAGICVGKLGAQCALPSVKDITEIIREC